MQFHDKRYLNSTHLWFVMESHLCLLLLSILLEFPIGVICINA
jgi:hypothetical protein